MSYWMSREFDLSESIKNQISTQQSLSQLTVKQYEVDPQERLKLFTQLMKTPWRDRM